MAWEKTTQTDPRPSSDMLVHPFYLLIPPKVLLHHCLSSLKAENFKKKKQILKHYKCLLFIKKSLTTVIHFELLSEKLKSIHCGRKIFKKGCVNYTVL